MAQFAVLIYDTDSAHAPDANTEELEVCDQHADELSLAGAMTAAWALTPRHMAKAVRRHSTTDGPFLETKEVVAGFYLIEADDIDAAVAIARTNPVIDGGGGLEVRPVHSGGFVS